ncbi:hypothetical protein [Rhizobium phage RHph_X2_28B]|uniref:hypothetical protein n=1 Tax=Rhizobium phage RHph_X2_28B TaxID=2836086 RepID=UPI0023294C3D|nr:hypothetical protein PP751_gp017 [Rhizobium phage RHph_X2_28B]QWY83469.1 hypothetical protein [Rhizobium phage RHph_X2_28B]QWY83705.1 hypothetical protein [Rhizobium phage RHph_X3_15]
MKSTIEAAITVAKQMIDLERERLVNINHMREQVDICAQSTLQKINAYKRSIFHMEAELKEKSSCEGIADLK